VRHGCWLKWGGPDFASVAEPMFAQEELRINRSVLSLVLFPLFLKGEGRGEEASIEILKPSPHLGGEREREQVTYFSRKFAGSGK
jgi:hypothetical protein